LDPQRWSASAFAATIGRTDRDGTCSLAIAVPRGAFHFEHPRYEERQIDDPTGWLPEGTEMVVRLAPLPVVRVRVEDAAGRDVEDVSFGYENLVAERFVWLEHETEHVDGREEHLVPYPTERFDLLARAAGFATM